MHNYKFMANTYTQLYIHAIFAVKGRDNLISTKWKDELYKYISGIISNKDQKLMIVNGVPNHIHLLIGLKPTCTISDLVRDIKANSSKWINEKKYLKVKFQWQNGFSAFSVSQSGISNLIKYIKNQEEHHQKKSFKEEYIEFLEAYKIEFKNKYIFTE